MFDPSSTLSENECSTTTTPIKIPIRIGTELSSHRLQVPPSRLYPSKQMLHKGPDVPDRHPSVILMLDLELVPFPLAVSGRAPKQSASYGQRLNVLLY